MDDEFLSLANNLEYSVKDLKKINKYLKEIENNINQFPPTIIEKYKEYAIPKNNIEAILNFYRNFLHFMKQKDDLIIKLKAVKYNINLDAFEELTYQLDNLEKYNKINIVREEVGKTRQEMKIFKKMLFDQFFSDIRKNLAKDEKLKKIGNFIEKENEVILIEKMVKIVTEQYFLNKKYEDTYFDLFFKLKEDFKKIEDILSFLFSEKIANLISTQITRTIPNELKPHLLNDLFVFNNRKDFKKLPYILSIYQFLQQNRKEIEFLLFTDLFENLTKIIANLFIDLENALVKKDRKITNTKILNVISSVTETELLYRRKEYKILINSSYKNYSLNHYENLIFSLLSNIKGDENELSYIFYLNNFNILLKIFSSLKSINLENEIRKYRKKLNDLLRRNLQKNKPEGNIERLNRIKEIIVSQKNFKIINKKITEKVIKEFKIAVDEEYNINIENYSEIIGKFYVF